MKYMGSKHSLLSSGLGELIEEESQHARRVVDLFCGGSSIAWFAAENIELPVLATDLQQYAVALAGSVVSRTNKLDHVEIAEEWFERVQNILNDSENWHLARQLQTNHEEVAKFVEASRDLCSSVVGIGPVWKSYGGHYFSPLQAVTIDAMLSALPKQEPFRTACLAAAISSGSHCAASPGHTAQPFQPTEGATRYIAEAWSKEPILIARRSLEQICARRAKVAGESVVGEAVTVASTLSSSDLVIVDPPYSGVQYSRFYHVLETIANGREESATGRGRYPPLSKRPQSSFSRPSESKEALVKLLSNLSKAQTTVIFTFPAGESSNGLSGDAVLDVSSRFFDIRERLIIPGRFSTLGGNNSHRAARSKSEELVLVMQSK